MPTGCHSRSVKFVVMGHALVTTRRRVTHSKELFRQHAKRRRQQQLPQSFRAPQPAPVRAGHSQSGILRVHASRGSTAMPAVPTI